MPRNNDLEQKALQLIFNARDDGILQSDMWKGLGVTSREGSRLALKFEEKGIIERRKILHNGRWTYKLFSQRKPITLESIGDSPCIVCNDINKCYSGGEISPLSCQLLTEWIYNSIDEESK